jgi:hypothetical protein
MELAGRGGMRGIFFRARRAVHSVPDTRQHCMAAFGLLRFPPYVRKDDD